MFPNVASVGLTKVFQDINNNHWIEPPDYVKVFAEVYVVKVYDCKTGETLWFPLGTSDDSLHIADALEDI